MTTGSLRDLYFDELADLYDAELQTVRLLPRLVEAARAPELREMLVRHADESRLHLERLQLIFTHWGERIGSRSCAGLAGIVQEADDRLNRGATPDVLDAAIIGIAQRVEHYELAGYGCARSYARRLNRLDEARLLHETLDEEARFDRRLTEIAEAHVNDDARTEGDLHDASRRHPLRYVAIDRMAVPSDWQRPPRVRNDADDELGVFDGVIVDPSARPRYVVVDAGGLFAHRRYLLPVSLVRLDEASRELRVNLTSDVAERYPAFDPNEFTTMSGEELRGYEMRLRDFLSGATGDRISEVVDAQPPEWLMTGVWITVPPSEAERLDESTRSFANEFTPTSSASSEGDRTGTGRGAPPVADGPMSIDEAVDAAAPARRRTGSREQLVAHSEDRLEQTPEDESPTPPHGDKLR